MTAGNFDKNDSGRTQVAFTIGLKTAVFQTYRYKLGIIGSNYDGSSTQNYTDDAHMVYYSNDIDNGPYLMDKGSGDDATCLNCNVISIDVMNDGLTVRYKNRGYAYSDPIVEGVLQAAPYYKDIQDAGNTQITITKSYEKTNGYSNSVAIGVGFAVKAEFVVASVSGSLGIIGGWGSEHRTAETVSYSKSFSALAKNTVLVERTPLFTSVYDVKNEDGTWEENKLQITSPQEPVWSQMTIDEYNKFVDQYNQLAAKYDSGVMEYLDDKGNPTDTVTSKLNSKYMQPLQKIAVDTGGTSGTGLYLIGNEGNPAGYLSSWTDGSGISAETLSQGDPIPLAYNGGTADITWTHSTSTTDIKTKSLAGHVAVACDIGFTIGGVKATGGVYFNADYTHGWSSSTSTTYATSASGTVKNLDKDSLTAKGMNDNTVESYAYRWSFGRWKTSLGKTNAEVPVYGYTVTDIKKPLNSVQDLRVSEDLKTGTLNFSWTKADGTSYKLYQLVSGKYQAVFTDPISDSTYSLPESSLDRSSGNLFQFALTAIDSSKVESDWSNSVTYVLGFSGESAYEVAKDNGFTGSASEWLASLVGTGVKSIDKTGTEGNIDTYTITMTNGNTTSFTVKNGIDAKAAKEITGFAKTSTDGTQDTYTITYSDGTTSDFVVDNGTDGTPGAAGRGIASIDKTSTDGTTDIYTVTYTDGTTSTMNVENGAGGTPAAAGNGITGIAKTSTEGNVDTYTISYSDGTTSTFTVTNGVNGTNGADGANGTNGTNGINGVDGTNGTSGTNGAAGSNGVSGANGTNGMNGTSGSNGTNGTNGLNGVNGSNGTNGTNGSNGSAGMSGSTDMSGTGVTNGTDSSNGTSVTGSTSGISDSTTADSAAGTLEVKSIAVDPSGNYIFTLSDGSRLNASGMKPVQSTGLISDGRLNLTGTCGITALWLLALCSLLWNIGLTIALAREDRRFEALKRFMTRSQE